MANGMQYEMTPRFARRGHNKSRTSGFCEFPHRRNHLARNRCKKCGMKLCNVCLRRHNCRPVYARDEVWK